MIEQVGILIAFFLSALLCPWWLTVFLAIMILSFFETPLLVIIGGLFMDLLFSAPIEPLGGFRYLYTTLFIFLSLLSWYLHQALSE